MIQKKIPNWLRKYLYAEMSLRGSGIQIASKKRIYELKGQSISELLWLKLENLYIRSKRLRPAGCPSKISTPECPVGKENWEITPSIREIARIYKRYPRFHSDPVLFHYELDPHNRKMVAVLYEGKHRCVGAKIAGRKYILSRQVWEEYSAVIAQKLEKNKNYFGKPLYNLHYVYDLYKNNPTY